MQSQRDLPLVTFKPIVQVYTVNNQQTGQYGVVGTGLLEIVTGLIECQGGQQSKDDIVDFIEVKSRIEPLNRLIMRSPIKKGNDYEIQKGSIILWRDISVQQQKQLALSFEEERQCDFFWRRLCDKIGKNYLDIKKNVVLKMPNAYNLDYFLQKTKVEKYLVEYHLLNSDQIINNLYNIFIHCKSNSQINGQIKISNILKSILTNLDHRLVQKLFRTESSFLLMLQVESFLKKSNYLNLYLVKLQLRKLFPLTNQLMSKILTIHRIAFYRENILNLKDQTYMECILDLTQASCYKEIINQMINESILDDILNFRQPVQNRSQNTMENINSNNIYAVQLSFSAQLQMQKLSFLIEAILMAKKIQGLVLKDRLIDRIYKSKALKIVMELLDRNVPKCIDFLICLSQAKPQRFIEHFKNTLNQEIRHNLHLKLLLQFISGDEQMKNGIIEILRNLIISLKIKDNFDFFNGTFFPYALSFCTDTRSILVLFNQMQKTDNIEIVYQLALSKQVFSKILIFLKSIKRNKIIELSAVKILKKIIYDYKNSKLNKHLTNQVHGEIINGGYFEYCMSLLMKNLNKNNIISSSMLNILKIIGQFSHFSLYHEYLHARYGKFQQLRKYLENIFKMNPQTVQHYVSIRDIQDKVMDIEQQQKYFLSEEQIQYINKSRINKQSQAKALEGTSLDYILQVDEKDLENQQIKELQKTRKIRKSDQSIDTVDDLFNSSLEIKLEERLFGE